jgi:Uma2 family endonuclease
MSVGIETRKRVWTEEEIQSLPEDGCLHEVVDGELIVSPKNNFQHEQICMRLAFNLESFNRKHKLGVVLGSSAGF